MMEAIRSYLTAVVAVSMIAVLASALSHGSRMERVVRFAAGLLALLVCVTPLLRLDVRTLTDVLEQAERALDYDASKTDRTRQDMLRDLIRENTARKMKIMYLPSFPPIFLVDNMVSASSVHAHGTFDNAVGIEILFFKFSVEAAFTHNDDPVAHTDDLRHF